MILHDSYNVSPAIRAMRIAARSMLLLMLVVLGLTGGCRSENPNQFTSASGDTASMEGNWQFTFASMKGAIGIGSGTLVQSGTSFSGTLTLTGDVCASMGPLSGNISGNSITAILTENGQAVSLTGTVGSNGSSASGTYTSDPGGCTNGDTGTWSGSNQSLSGTFLGAIKPEDRMPVRILLKLKDEDGSVSGLAFFANSVCLTTVSIAGHASESSLELRANSQNGAVLLRGTIDSTRNILALDSELTGPCGSESGAATIVRIQ